MLTPASSELIDDGCELPAVESGDSLAFQACHASEGSLEGASDEPRDGAESECFNPIDPMNSVRRLLALRPLWPLSMCYPAADEEDAADFASPSGWSLGQGALDDDDDDDDDEYDDDDERPRAAALPGGSGVVVPRLGEWEEDG